jgi:outer membrane lipopolysaccharide assembly protein LptE/RlpB
MDLPEQATHLSSTAELGQLVRKIRKELGLSNRFVIDLERGKETLQIQKVLDVLGLLGLELTARRKS